LIWIAAVALIALAAVLTWYLGFIGAFESWWPAILVFFGAYFIANWMGASALRCPVCRVRYTGDIYAGLTSKKASRRFNYCPGCGLNLEDQWRDPKRL